MLSTLPAKQRRTHWATEAHVRNGERVNLRKGLVAYWKLNEATSAVRQDSTANALHLSDVNGVSQVAGKIGNAAAFNYTGFDRWLDHAVHSLLKFDGDFTVSCWVYRTGSQFGMDNIINQAGGVYFYTHNVVSQKPLLEIRDPSNAQIVYLTGNTIISVNQWYHLVIYRKGFTFAVIVNNGTPAVVHNVLGTVKTTGGFRIGAHEGGYPFTGRIDDVGKWNRALNPNEITALFSNGNALPYENF
jgi:hypothetical protein